MSEKERKQLMFAIPLLAVAAFMVYWFIFRQPTGDEAVAPVSPPTETTERQPGPPMTEAGGVGPPFEEVQVVAAPREYEPSQEPARDDPFLSYTRVKIIKVDPKKLFKMLRPPPTIPPVPNVPPPIRVDVEEQRDEHERRMAGMIHNGRVWAIYERDGVGLVVKPGDPVQDETVVAITKDYLIVRSLDGHEYEVPLERVAGYEVPGPGYTPGRYPLAPGAPRPPAPPRPPGAM